KDFSLHVHSDLARQVAVSDGRGHLGDVADLRRQVVGHRVDVVGQVLPGAGHALDFRLTTQLAFGPHRAVHGANFGSEGVQLVHHGVDGVLQFQDLTLNIHCDLAREVATGHGGGDFGNIADLGGEVAGHGVDLVS